MIEQQHRVQKSAIAPKLDASGNNIPARIDASGSNIPARTSLWAN